MSMLVDVSYFTAGPRQIRNATTAKMPNPASIMVNELINGYIKDFQRKFLNDIVGCTLAGQIMDYLDLVGQETEPDKEGNISPYELVCRQIRDSFADYVFFHILKNLNVDATVTGLVQLKCENKYVAPIQKQVSIWNGMVERNRQFVRWAMSDECPYKVSIDKNLLTPINIFNL